MKVRRVSFEDQITVTYPDDVSIDFAVLYSNFLTSVEELGGKAKVEEVSFTESYEEEEECHE